MVPVFKETSSLPLLDRLLALELRGGAGVQRDIKPTSLRPSPRHWSCAVVPVFKETSSLPLLDHLLALELRGGAGVQRDIKPTSLRPSPGTGAARWCRCSKRHQAYLF